jgi:hypothetical protein
MKKTLSLGLALLLTVLFASCGQATGVKSGAAAGEALVKMMPKGTTGVVAVDVKRVLGTEAVVKALQDPKTKEKYDEFVKMCGIDPMKDISYIAVGLTGMPMGGAPDGAAIINLKYDRARLEGLIKEKAPQAKGELYNGVTIYSGLDGGGTAKQTTGAAFLDASHIIIGTEKGVKGLIDVQQKKAESSAKDPELSSILKKVDKSGYAWGAFLLPQELIKKGIESNPQLKVLEGIIGLTLMFDDRLNNIVADIRTIGGTKEQNANLAATVNGFKAMGAMFGGQEPAVGELLNGIEITSGVDYVRIHLNVSHETMDKVGKLAQSKAGEFIKGKKDGSQ